MITIGIDISVLNEKRKTGVQVYTYELIKALLEINNQDNFILFGIATLDTYDFLKNIEFKKNPNVTLKIFKLPARLFRTFFLLWQKLNWPVIENFVGDVDAFHSFNWNLPPQKKGQVVATVFDMTPLLFPKYHQRKTIQLDQVRLERIKKYADLVITISENSKKDFLKFAPGKKVEVIYPGISEIFLQKKDPKKVRAVLKKYNLQPGYILSVGTLEPRKNIRNLIKACLESQLEKKLVLVGNWGWEKSDLLGIINNNQDKIITTGFVDDEELTFLYSQAFCLLYPSFYEGFGLPILEAQACGCPVVTSNVSSMPEVAGDGAILVNPYSTEDIIRGIKEVGEVREELVKRGFENVKRFEWIESAKKLNSLYQSL